MLSMKVCYPSRTEGGSNFLTEVDEHHAADLFAISEGHTLTTQQKEEAVMALHLGAYYLWNLYADMAKQA